MEVWRGLSFGVQTTEKEVMRKEKHVEEEASADEEIIYKIDVPANRYAQTGEMEGIGRP
jgi:phenylalanyl-tRNA synthetase beta chain